MDKIDLNKNIVVFEECGTIYHYGPPLFICAGWVEPATISYVDSTPGQPLRAVTITAAQMYRKLNKDAVEVLKVLCNSGILLWEKKK